MHAALNPHFKSAASIFLFLSLSTDYISSDFNLIDAFRVVTLQLNTSASSPADTKAFYIQTAYFSCLHVTAAHSAPIVLPLCYNCQPWITECIYKTAVRAFQHHFAEKYWLFQRAFAKVSVTECQFKEPAHGWGPDRKKAHTNTYH